MGFLDKFLEQMFTFIIKDRQSDAIKDLMKKDPEFAKDYKKIQQSKKRIEKRFKTMTQEEIDAELGRKQ